jgi:hypothetical protein
MRKLNVIIIIISLLILMTSCSSINEVDEKAVKDVTEKITEALINSFGKEAAKKEESFTMEAGSLSTLNIDSSVGDIKIETNDSNEAVINLKITAKSSSKEASEKLIEDFDYKVEERSNSIYIRTVYDNDKLRNNGSLTTDLTISIPKNIRNIKVSLNVGDIDISNAQDDFVIHNNVGDISISNAQGNFVIDTNVGNIEIKDSKGSYDLLTDVGNIVLVDSIASESSEFDANTGDIELSFTDISNSEAIKAHTGVGDIKLVLPHDSSYNAVINEFMKDERVESKGSGQTKIELETNVGDIDFN